MDVHLNDYMFAYIVYVYVYMRVYIYMPILIIYIFCWNLVRRFLKHGYIQIVVCNTVVFT